MKAYLVHERLMRDHWAPVYDRLLAGYHDLIEWRSLWRKLRPCFSVGGLILDAGCGTGRFIKRLTEWEGRVVGVDLSLQSLLFARRRLAQPPRLAQGDVRFLPFADAVFDQVLCSQVISHLIEENDAVMLLRELRRVIRPGGQLMITAYNYNFPRRIMHDKFRANFSNINYRRYTAAEFRSLLSRVFLPQEVARVSGILNFITKPLSLGSVLHWRGYPVLVRADLWLERTLLGLWLGHLLVAEIKRHESC